MTALSSREQVMIMVILDDRAEALRSTAKTYGKTGRAAELNNVADDMELLADRIMKAEKLWLDP